MRIKKGDTVQVLSGNDKGKKGEVLQVMPKDSKIVVKGVNVRKKHIKPNSMNPQGEVVEKELPIFASKVMHWDESAKKGTRVKFEIKNDKKVRVSVVSGKEI